MKPKVMWVEDSARLELRNLTGPVYFSGKYDFQLAEDVTQAINFLLVKPFDALIIDIRLPPGLNAYWQNLYRQSGADKVKAQLGLKLISWLVGKEINFNQLPPKWVDVKRIAVFSVESPNEIRPHLKELGINLYLQKAAGLRDTALLDLINEVLI